MRDILLSLLCMEQEVAQYKPLLQEFEAMHPGYHVKIELMNWEEAWAKLFSYTIRGEGVHVSEIGSNWSNVVVGMNTLRPFHSAEVEKLGGQAAFFPMAWKSTHPSNESVVWSIPFRVNTYVVMYRRDLLVQAGINEQTAFINPASFAQTIQHLFDAGVKTPFLMAGDYYHVSLLHIIASWVWAMGGDYIGEQDDHVLFNRPEARAGIKTWFELYRQIAPAYRALSKADVMNKFVNGESAIWVEDMSWSVQIADGVIQADKHVRESLGVAAMPGIPFVGGSNLVVWQQAGYALGSEAIAVELASYLASYQGQKMIHDSRATEDHLSARKDILSLLDEPNPMIKETIERTLQTGRSHNAVRRWTLIEMRLSRVLADMGRAVLSHPKRDLDSILDEFLIPLEYRLNQILAM